MRRLPALVLPLMLAACGGGSGENMSAGVGVVPTPTPTASPTPTPSPTPAPTPTPSPTPAPSPKGILDDGVTIVVAEGDSITSPNIRESYIGAFVAAHPGITLYDTAVGGSMIPDLLKRRAADLALKPDILTVFIGANDFDYNNVQGYAQAVFDYIAPFKALGTKVYIGTVLPLASGGTVNPVRNDARRRYSAIMLAAVGNQIDGVFDFSADATMGQDNAPLNLQLYADGVHPTGRNATGTGGHDYLYSIYETTISAALAKL